MSILYGAPPSPFVRKVMLAHAFKSLPYQLKIVPPGSDDEGFKAASPLGKIPAYQTDKGTGFADSSVIIAYIEKTSTDVALYPSDAEDYAMALWYEEYSDTKMMEAFGALYFERVVGPKFFNHTTDDERVELAISKLIPTVLDYLESQITADEWLVADQFSSADVAVGAQLVGLIHADYQIDAQKWPKLSAYNERFISHELVQAQVQTELGMLNHS
ncbi:glutathione S-transferase family protein [Endozoicomonas sp. G2_1]|uniref:glutathione S-transferase family protein n=1 Tax=Endozoicomonas sp. G2_1 TaxID=2821091 RepID=UPI001ADD1320|nr:glutathione S-transferase family protein [Endozoicomonas sp. G2_1]MBO9492470.1 glutathione S-transferase family protein [Endozoicomonas sp. G2_1]